MGRAFFLLLALIAGCALDRSPIVGDPIDSGVVDAFVGLDAQDPPDAVAPPDAIDPPDAPDGGPGDAGCVPATDRCNLVDDDCDGAIDEGSACGCEQFEFAGHVYQDCPPISGHDAWTGHCERLGPGYHLAIVGSADENAEIARQVDVFTWIGLNDFEANGTYVWADRSTPGFLGPFFGTEGTRSSEACFFVHGGGEWDDLVCGATCRVLCEGDPAMPCVPSGVDDGCDGIDQDCDGRRDEDCDLGSECTARSFWDHAYQVCEGPLGFDDATTACNGAGYRLTSIQHQTENEAIDQWISEGWIGLRQLDGRPDPDDVWNWVDGSTSTYTRWGGGQPDDSNGSENDMENCARMRTTGDWSDRPCSEGTAFVCERAADIGG